MGPALLSSAARSLSQCLSSRAMPQTCVSNIFRMSRAPFNTASMAIFNGNKGSSSSSSMFMETKWCSDGLSFPGSFQRRSTGPMIGTRNPFKGKAFVSYSSPDGTPFYYPGEGFSDLGIHPDKLLQPGDPDTFQVKIRDVMPVGYFVDMPSGREGYLPANDLGFSGGIERLRTIFQVGQEVTVRITFRGGGGRELLSIRKFDPDRPPVEPPKVARSSGSGKRKISSMMRRRAQQQQQQQQQQNSA